MYVHVYGWYRIENFIYTMVKFNVSSCTLMVCVSDPKCMKLCADSSFPCYDFQYSKFHSVSHALRYLILCNRVYLSGPMVLVIATDVVEWFCQGKALPSALEQIGELKLLHLPKALDRGVSLHWSFCVVTIHKAYVQ